MKTMKNLSGIRLGLAAGVLMRHVLMDKADENGSPVIAADASGRQPDVDLGAIVSKAVTAALDAAGIGKAPAVHARGEPTKDDVDAMVREGSPERAEQRRQSEAAGRAAGVGGSRSIQRGYSQDDAEQGKDGGTLVAEYIGWMAAAGGNVERAQSMAKKAGRIVVAKALGESTFSAGGALVANNVEASYIELLRNASVYLGALPTKIDIVNGNLTLPKQTGGATPTWIGESTNAAASQQTTGAVRIVLKKLAVLTAASNEFIRDAGPVGIQMLRDDLSQAAGTEIDVVGIRGLGTEYKPRGMLGWVPSAQNFDTYGTTVAFITSDLNRMFQTLEEAKIAGVRLAIFMSPRTKWALMSKRDGNNNLIWAEEMKGGTLMGAKLCVTQNIPNTIGTGSTCSEIFLADMAQQLYAEERGGMLIDVRDGVAYHDGSAVVSAYSRDESAVRLTQRIDIVERQAGVGIARTYNVAYAA